jgi:23S rRNA-/tRNA-specific pseudouridylate synthase
MRSPAKRVNVDCTLLKLRAREQTQRASFTLAEHMSHVGMKRADPRCKLTALRAYSAQPLHSEEPSVPGEQGGDPSTTSVVFEDEHYLFVNKPGGVRVEGEDAEEQVIRL